MELPQETEDKWMEDKGPPPPLGGHKRAHDRANWEGVKRRRDTLEEELWDLRPPRGPWEDEMALEPPPGQRAWSPKRPIEDQDGEEPLEGLEAGEEANFEGPRTRRQAAKERKVMFAVESALEGDEFESVCTRRQDGTVDMEPTNLTRMCTLLKEKVSKPYRQNKQAARYHLYAKESIRLPAGTAVEADLGY